MNSYNGFTHTQRMKAFNWLKIEYASGRRKKPTQCDACGQTKGILEHHSEDYSAPYGNHIGAWSLCYRCHMMIHCRFRNKTAWRRYRERLATGIIFAPFYTRNFKLFAQQLHGEMPVDIDLGHARPDVLAKIDNT